MPRTPRPARLQAELERMAVERLASERRATRDTRRELAKVCVQCVGSSGLGALVMGYAWHTTDPDIGKIFWWSGMVVGYSGIAISILSAYRRGEERGDW